MSALIVTSVVSNILCVVGIVICNKYITEVDGYNFMIFLSFLHFTFTSIGTRLLLSAGAFTYKDAPIKGVLPVALVCYPLNNSVINNFCVFRVAYFPLHL
jgi:hypothetical protein